MIYSDGMTVYRGNTPKFGKLRHSKGVQHLTNRVIGVEIVCGPVNGVFLYHTDSLVGGGANILIEVTRQAMIDLAEILKTKFNKQMPSKMIFQFDNCGENKNKYMLTYFSMLVETGTLDQVEVNFSIVEHTYTSLDQYFSVLSSAIAKTDFIGSPLSL